MYLLKMLSLTIKWNHTKICKCNIKEKRLFYGVYAKILPTVWDAGNNSLEDSAN